MNRKDFGQLLATLRQDLDWTQFQLSEYANVDNAVISQIERGVKKFFEPELLFRLANTLQLTTLERREFFLAASGLEDKQFVRQPSMSVSTNTHNIRKTLDRLVQLTREMLLPAFLCDVYGDVVAANNIILGFFKVPPSVLETAANIPGGYNTVRINFGRDLVGRTHVADHWDGYAINSMRAFRENSLRYRAKPYFKYLMKAFRNPVEYPFFDRYWKLVSSTEEDKEANVDYFSYHHNEFGDLTYTASSTVSITSYGELFLIHYLPCDDHTDQVFDQIKRQVGAGVTRFAPWPEKPMP
jgi:transcriptional regulator with XRE-family HTH domain